MRRSAPIPSKKVAMTDIDSQVSWHFRGPLTLKQFAFYTPGNGRSKREWEPTLKERRHGHQHQHLHDKAAPEARENHIIEEKGAAEEKRDCNSMITATIDGAVVSWPNTFCAGAGTSTPPPRVIPAAVTSAPSTLPSVNAGTG